MIWIGTSGYSFPEWKGSFYPADLPDSKMLAYYATRLTTVEINYTFNRIPNHKTLSAWLEATPEAFRLTLKAPKRITHDARLADCDELLQVFCERARFLGERLGVVLFQLPPFLRKNVERLQGFLELLPPGLRTTFEFRHASWHDEEVFACLRGRGAALCVSDSAKLSAPVVATADYAYFRLRDEGYTEADLTAWAERVRDLACAEKFVYFKHEEEGKGAELALELRRQLGV